MSNPDVWSKTVLFHMYDENDGFFDHVAPPVAPPGTDGEYLTVQPLPEDADGFAGSIGLGFRVPMLVISPFSRGGHVCHETFDHTSQLRFLEERFGVRAPNLSAWRRTTAGDLTAALQSKPGGPGAPSASADDQRPELCGGQGVHHGGPPGNSHQPAALSGSRRPADADPRAGAGRHHLIVPAPGVRCQSLCGPGRC